MQRPISCALAIKRPHATLFFSSDRYTALPFVLRVLCFQRRYNQLLQTGTVSKRNQFNCDLAEWEAEGSGFQAYLPLRTNDDHPYFDSSGG